jgi:hypothetical protein
MRAVYEIFQVEAVEMQIRTLPARYYSTSQKPQVINPLRLTCIVQYKLPCIHGILRSC